MLREQMEMKKIERAKITPMFWYISFYIL